MENKKKKDKIKQLVKRITKEQNPSGRKNTWHYVAVKHAGFFKVHEIHFNDKGKLIGVSKDPVELVGYDNKMSLLGVLGMATGDIAKYPHITKKELELL